MKWIVDIVNGLIEMYKTRNVYDLLDLLEITLIRKKLYNGEKGRFFRDLLNNEYIYVSDDLSVSEEKVVIAHELGHLILHTHINTNYYNTNSLLVKSKLEVEANKFAAELIIPDNVNLFEYETIKQLACCLEVPEELIKLKYKDVI